MPEKDPLSYSLLTYAWVIGIAMLGGFVNFHQKVKKGIARAWNLNELFGEIVTSGFAGVMTFFICEFSNTPPMLEAFFVGVSGHMGARMIFIFEKYMESRAYAITHSKQFIPKDDDEDQGI